MEVIDSYVSISMAASLTCSVEQRWRWKKLQVVGGASAEPFKFKRSGKTLGEFNCSGRRGRRRRR